MNGIGIYNLDFFYQKTGQELLKENITRILLTAPGERVGKPFFGSRLRDFILSSVGTEEIEEEIINAISKWEPNVSINKVSVIKKTEEAVEVAIMLTDISSQINFSYELLLKS